MVAWTDMTEREWQRDVVKLAKLLGWKRIYHTHDSRRSAHGFPDLVLVRERVIFLELKTEATTSKLTDEQRGWLRHLRQAGAEAYVARPRHLDALARALRGPNTLDLSAYTIAELANNNPRKEKTNGREL